LSMEWPRQLPRPVLRRRQGEDRATGARDSLPGRSNAHSVREQYFVEVLAPRSPSRIRAESDCKLAVLRGPVRRTDRGRS